MFMSYVQHKMRLPYRHVWLNFPSVVDVLVSRPGPAPFAVTDHLF